MRKKKQHLENMIILRKISRRIDLYKFNKFLVQERK